MGCTSRVSTATKRWLGCAAEDGRLLQEGGMSKADQRDKWLKRLANEDKAHAGWRKRPKAADEAYCSYDSDKTGPLFPVFTTTVKTIHGRIYGQPPKPDVRKRHPSGPQNQAPSAPVPQGLPPPAGPQNG